MRTSCTQVDLQLGFAGGPSNSHTSWPTVTTKSTLGISVAVDSIFRMSLAWSRCLSPLPHSAARYSGLRDSHIRVFPNGVDRRLFFRHDKISARAALGLAHDVHIVAFVGRFVHGKGPDRVVAAIQGLPKTHAILIGEGPNTPVGDQILFQGVVEHQRLPLYLSASDVFVLPTTGEGSCNAILEALACGLPVVSSVGDFNDEILSPDVSIRVDPLDVGEIRAAITALLLDERRRVRMGENSLERARRFSIDTRARGIVDWMQARVGVVDRQSVGPTA